MYQSCDKGQHSLYCGKWKKISKSCRDLDLDQTMPNFTHTHRQTDRHTDGHEYSIVAVDKWQL